MNEPDCELARGTDVDDVLMRSDVYRLASSYTWFQMFCTYEQFLALEDRLVEAWPKPGRQGKAERHAVLVLLAAAQQLRQRGVARTPTDFDRLVLTPDEGLGETSDSSRGSRLGRVSERQLPTSCFNGHARSDGAVRLCGC